MSMHRFMFNATALSVICLPVLAQPPKPGAPCQPGEPHPMAILIDHAEDTEGVADL